jgi:two-component system alkaline phosphatase synthesis response regulator PhoP
VRSALTQIGADVRVIRTMRQLRLVYRDREPDLVILEVAELSAERLTTEIDLLRGGGIHSPLFVISSGVLADDRLTIITDVADFATAEATANEIVARLSRLLGQTQPKSRSGAEPSTLPPSRTINGVQIDWRTKEATYGDLTVRFSTAELRMLEALLERRGRTLSTGALLRAVWGEGRQRSESLVPVYIWAVRGKLSRFGANFGIETMIGSGYRLTIGAKTPRRRKSGGPRHGPTRRSA